jgi:hypothetical protein
MVGDDFNEISDVITVAINIIKLHCGDNYSEYIGLYTPAQLHFMSARQFHEDTSNEV